MTIRELVEQFDRDYPNVRKDKEPKTMDDNNGFIGHAPPTRAQKEQAVKDWRRAAEHEKFRIENDLCYGDTATAARNAARYEQVADEIEAELNAVLEE